MTKDEMIAYLMEELGSTTGDDNIYDIAAHFYKKWLDEQESSDVLEIYSGNKKYWEI